jgi:hypothetical protein
MIRVAGLFIALTALLPAMSAAAEKSYSFAYVRFAEGQVTLQRASETDPEEVGVNHPVLPSDRLWTGTNGRAEIEFADRSRLRLDERTKVDFLEFAAASRRETLLRQWSGSTILRWSGEEGERFRIDGPAGTVFPASKGLFRIDVHEGGQWVTVSAYEGVVELASEGGSVLVRAGQRSVVRGAERPGAPFDFNTAHADDFDRWSEDRDRRLARSRYVEGVPEEVSPYVSDLDDYGYWQYDVTYGPVWYPVVGAGWAPYTYGRWWYTPLGWTWCSYEPWGWAPYHYGRWGYSSYGWFWIPGRHWGPAWVSWAIGPSWVGWCPLGYYNRPVVVFESVFYRGGRAVPRHRAGNGWSFARADDFSSRSIERSRLRAEDVRLSAREARLLESGGSLDRELRPRDGISARPGREDVTGVSTPVERAEPGELRRGPTAVRRGGGGLAGRPQSDEAVESQSQAGRENAPQAEPGEVRSRGRVREGREDSGAAERLGRRERDATGSPRVRPRYRDRESDGGGREPRSIRPGEIQREDGSATGSEGEPGGAYSRPEISRGGTIPLRRSPGEIRNLPARERSDGSRRPAETGPTTRQRDGEASEPRSQGGIERSRGGSFSSPFGRVHERTRTESGSGGEVRSRPRSRDDGSYGRSQGSVRQPSSGGASRGESAPRYRSPDRGSSRSPASGSSGSSVSRGGSGRSTSSGSSGSAGSGSAGASSTRRSRQK